MAEQIPMHIRWHRSEALLHLRCLECGIEAKQIRALLGFLGECKAIQVFSKEHETCQRK